jgi:hypothetical protein
VSPSEEPGGFLYGVRSDDGDLRFLPVAEEVGSALYPEQVFATPNCGDGAIPAAGEDFVGLGAKQAVLGFSPAALLAASDLRYPQPMALVPDGGQGAACQARDEPVRFLSEELKVLLAPFLRPPGCRWDAKLTAFLADRVIGSL